MQIWYGRPSGHSTYYTVVGVYDSKEQAKKAVAALKRAIEKDKEDRDWSSEDASVSQDGKMAFFSVETDHYVDEIEEIMERYEPTKVRSFEYAQEIGITFAFDSPDVSPEEIKIIMALQYPSLLNELNQGLKYEEQVLMEEGKTKFTISYYGDEIYNEDESTLIGYPINELGQKLGCEIDVGSY
jgi:hypothetical protein